MGVVERIAGVAAIAVRAVGLISSMAWPGQLVDRYGSETATAVNVCLS